MADTTNYFFNRPTVGGSEDTWGADLNENWAKLDALLYGASYTDGDANTVERIRPDLEEGQWAINGTVVTSTGAELNKLDGVTWTLTGLNGLTATVTQLNYLNTASSNIQTQLDALSSGKQPLDAALTSIAGVVWTADKIPRTTGVDTFSALNFRDEDNMASNDAAGLPSQQSVKAYVDTTVAAVEQGWDFVETITSFTSGRAETSTFDTGYEYMIYVNNLAFTKGTNNQTFSIEVYKGTSGSYHSSVLGLSNSTTNTTPFFNGTVYLPNITRSLNRHFFHAHIQVAGSSVTGEAGSNFGVTDNGVFSLSSAEPITKVRIGNSAWTYASGNFAVYRRKIVI